MHTHFISYIQNFDNSEYIGNRRKTSNVAHPILTPEYRHLSAPNQTESKYLGKGRKFAIGGH
jgi:hypothetical protein